MKKSKKCKRIAVMALLVIASGCSTIIKQPWPSRVCTDAACVSPDND